MKVDSRDRTNILRHTDAMAMWLDLIRWLAAFEVLLFHARHRILDNVKFDHSNIELLLYYLLGIVSSLGQPAVIIFFVISGFLVGGTSLQKYNLDRKFDAAGYFLSRLTRLWIVLIPALILIGVLNLATVSLSDPSSTLFKEVSEFRSHSEGFGGLVCNLAFMQTAFCVQYGGNGALWSLFNEFWYYAAWPLILVGIWSRESTLRRLCYLLSAVAMLLLLSFAQFTGANIALYFSLWLLGVAAANRERAFISVSPLKAALLLILGLLFWRIMSKSQLQGANIMREYPCDLTVAFLTANLIMCMKETKQLAKPPLSTLHTRLAAFSFTLYVIHTPAIYTIVAVLQKFMPIDLNMKNAGLVPFLTYTFTVVGCVIIAYMFSLVTEKHTVSLRNFLQEGFGRSVLGKSAT